MLLSKEEKGIFIMPKKPKEIEKILLADGWIFKAQEGSHRHYIHPKKYGKVTIPFQKDEETFPKPSAPNEINLAKIAEDLEVSSESAFINIVTVDVVAYAKTHFEKSVKKTLTIPAWLNTAALEQNINFSQVLQEALISKLHL